MEEINKCNEIKKSILLSYLQQIDYTLIKIDLDTLEFAKKFIDYGILNKKCINDCIHIATAILAGCDIVISWNLKHIANIKTIRGIRAITGFEGYKDLLLYPPPSLLTED